jgi:hypothetical protein
MIQPTEQPIHHGRVAGAPSRGAARAALWLLACGLFGLGSTAQGQTAYPPAANLSSGNYLYWGSPSVISNYSFAVSGSAAVSFMASGSIVLNNGFSATAGATGTVFQARISPAPPAPGLVSVSPSIGVQGTSVAVNLTGSNFVSGGVNTVSASTGIAVSNVAVVNASLITATLTIASTAAAGAGTLRVATAGGTSAPVTFTVQAAQTLTILTNPSGLQITVGGASQSTPYQWTCSSGSITVGVSSTPQSGGAGIQYVYGSWSDYGLQTHNITCPASSTTVTAVFTTQYYLTMTAGANGWVSPASGWHNSTQSFQISATPSSNNFSFSNWSGTGLGSYTGPNQSPSITMGGPISETANFTPIAPQYQPTTAVYPPGAGSVTPTCTSGCSYSSGSGVPVSATANTGYAFSSWSGSGSGSYSGAAPSATVTMSGPITETANFVTASPPPVITSLSTSSWLVSSAVQISGNNFGGSQGSSTVTFNGIPAPVIIFNGIAMWSPTSIWVTVPNGATSGNVAVNVGAAASNGEPFTVTVAPLGPKTSRHVTVGSLPVSWYSDELDPDYPSPGHPNKYKYPATLFSTYACPSGSSVRGCFQTFLETLAGQGVTGIREYIGLCDSTSQAFTPSCDPTNGIAIDPNWVANLANFFSDVQSAGIADVAITPTVGVSTGWVAFPVSQTTSPAANPSPPNSCADAGGNCCIDTPGSPGYDPTLDQNVYFHPIIPFGMKVTGDPIGDTYVTDANNFGYKCAPINNNNFVGWSNIFSLIDAMLDAARGKVNIAQLEFLQAEINLYKFPAQLRYIVDTYPGHAIAQPSPSCTLTGTDVLCELRALMTKNQFDPGRVAWSGTYMDPTDNQTNCTNVYTDFARNTPVDEIAAAIGGGVIGREYCDPNDPNFGSCGFSAPANSGLPCGGKPNLPDTTPYMFQSPYYNTQPSIIDAHIYPSIVKSGDLGGGAPEQNQSTPAQSQAVIQAVAQTDYSDLTHLLGLVSGLQSATVVIGETYYGTMYPGVVPGFSTKLCWSAPTSAPAANALGFEQSALFGYPVIFRPFMTLENASGGCFAYGNGPASTYTYPNPNANYQNVNLNGQGPYVPTKQ